MTVDGVFPKVDGDIMYGRDANMAYFQAVLSDTLNHASVNIADSATEIKAVNTSRKCILLKNNGSVTVYIGEDNTVTTLTGYPLEAGESIYIYDTEAVYGITASGTGDIRYLEVQ